LRLPKRRNHKKREDTPKDKNQTLFEFKEVEIKDGEIIYKDHPTGKTETLDIASLKIKAPLFGGGADIDIKGSYNKTPFQVNGNITATKGRRTKVMRLTRIAIQKGR